MGYIEESLIPGEEIIAKARLHWASLVYPFIIAALGFLMGILTFTGEDTVVCGCFGWLIFLAGLVGAVRALITYFTTEFALTNKRIIAKRGLVRRHSLELILAKVESVRVKQPIVGRLFDYGTIVATGTGGTEESFPSIASPMGLRKKIISQIDKLS